MRNVPGDRKTSWEEREFRAVISFMLSSSDSLNTHIHTQTQEQRHTSEYSNLVSTSCKLGPEQRADKYSAAWLIMLAGCTAGKCVYEQISWANSLTYTCTQASNDSFLQFYICFKCANECCNLLHWNHYVMWKGLRTVINSPNDQLWGSKEHFG